MTINNELEFIMYLEIASIRELWDNVFGKGGNVLKHLTLRGIRLLKGRPKYPRHPLP